MLRPLLAVLALGLAAPAFAAAPDAPKPSFDCATAKSKVKVMICASDDLAKLDVAEENAAAPCPRQGHHARRRQ